MGGSGSGRISFLRATTTNQMRSLELPWLRKKNLLRAHCRTTLTWSRNGNKTAEIGYECQYDGINLNYRSRSYGEDWESISDFIRFTYTDTQFGGRRTWLECPTCRRRCTVLYGGKYFRCRTCHDLKYESQYEQPWSRPTSRALKIREKLGDNGGLDEPFPLKPKGMHWKKYWKLEEEYQQGLHVWRMICINWLDRVNIGRRLK